MPQRSAGGHRQYSQRDIDALKWLMARQDEGVSISHAIDMWQSTVERGEDPLHQSAAAAASAIRVAPLFEGSQLDDLRKAWLSACLNLDRAAAEQILAAAFASYPPEMVCFEILRYGLSEVGNAWYRGEASVQQEHFTTAITNQRLELLIAAAPPPSRSERVVIFSAPGDFHIFSPLLFNYLLRQQGYDVVYLGADVPVDQLPSAASKVNPDLAIVTAQLLHTAAALKDVAAALQSQNISLAFGGLAFNLIPNLRHLIPGYFLGETLEESYQRALQLIGRKPPVSPKVEVSEAYEKALAQYSRRQALIESQIWGTFIATNKPTKNLAKMNDEIGQVIEAALKLGDLSVLSTDISWIEYLLTSYRPSKELIYDYLQAYLQAATIYLEDDASMIIDWLADITSLKDSQFLEK